MSLSLYRKAREREREREYIWGEVIESLIEPEFLSGQEIGRGGKAVEDPRRYGSIRDC